MANTSEIVVEPKKYLRIVLIVVLVLVLVAVAYSLFRPKPAPELPPVPTGNLEANVANGGTAVFSGDEVLISDPVQSQILKVTPGETTGTPVNGALGRYLNVDGDTLYYADAQTKYLMKTMLNGSTAQTLLEKPVSRILLYDGYLYYLDMENNCTLCRLSLDADAQPELLSDARVQQFAIYRGDLFYQDLNQDNSAFVMNLDGSNVTPLPLRFGALLFCVGDRLFYSDPDQNGAMCCLQIEIKDGESVYKKPVTLNTGVVSGAVADDSGLYYINALDGLLYRLSYTDANAQPEALTNLSVCGLQLAGGYVYYGSVTEENVLSCVVVGNPKGTGK